VGGLKPSSLIEVYAYEYKSSYLENTVVAFKYFLCVFLGCFVNVHILNLVL